MTTNSDPGVSPPTAEATREQTPCECGHNHMWFSNAFSRWEQYQTCNAMGCDCGSYRPSTPSTPRTGAPSDAEIIRSFDARDWASAFVRMVRDNPAIAISESTMLSWFANALMRGYDEHARRAESVAPPDLGEIGTCAECDHAANWLTDDGRCSYCVYGVTRPAPPLLTDEDRKQLATSDYQGRAFKTALLDDIERRHAAALASLQARAVRAERIEQAAELVSDAWGDIPFGCKAFENIIADLRAALAARPTPGEPTNG